LGQLGINAWFLGSQIVSFVILWVVLQRYVFPVITRMLDRRAAAIREGIENAEKAKRELAEAEARIQQMMAQARQEAQQTLAQAVSAAEHVRAELEKEARGRADQIIQQAQVRIQQETARAKAELRTQVADLAILAASRVLGASLSDTDHRRLIEDFVVQSKELSSSS
jgi:F-type H+-transporting ATPase subunit b